MVATRSSLWALKKKLHSTHCCTTPREAKPCVKPRSLSDDDNDEGEENELAEEDLEHAAARVVASLEAEKQQSQIEDETYASQVLI